MRKLKKKLLLLSNKLSSSSSSTGFILVIPQHHVSVTALSLYLEKPKSFVLLGKPNFNLYTEIQAVYYSFMETMKLNHFSLYLNRPPFSSVYKAFSKLRDKSHGKRSVLNRRIIILIILNLYHKKRIIKKGKLFTNSFKTIPQFLFNLMIINISIVLYKRNDFLFPLVSTRLLFSYFDNIPFICFFYVNHLSNIYINIKTNFTDIIYSYILFKLGYFNSGNLSSFFSKFYLGKIIYTAFYTQRIIRRQINYLRDHSGVRKSFVEYQLPLTSFNRNILNVFNDFTPFIKYNIRWIKAVNIVVYMFTLDKSRPLIKTVKFSFIDHLFQWELLKNIIRAPFNNLVEEDYYDTFIPTQLGLRLFFRYKRPNAVFLDKRPYVYYELWDDALSSISNSSSIVSQLTIKKINVESLMDLEVNDLLLTLAQQEMKQAGYDKEDFDFIH